MANSSHIDDDQDETRRTAKTIDDKAGDASIRRRENWLTKPLSWWLAAISQARSFTYLRATWAAKTRHEHNPLQPTTKPSVTSQASFFFLSMIYAWLWCRRRTITARRKCSRRPAYINYVSADRYRDIFQGMPVDCRHVSEPEPWLWSERQ